MLIDVLQTDLWEELNTEVAAYLASVGPFDINEALESSATKIKVRSYKGLAHAAYEITKGTAQFMAHKKTIGFVSGQTDVIQKTLGPFYQEGFDIQARSHLDLSNVKEWVDALPRETCFVIFSEDNPVTGEIFSFVDELDECLNQKRINSFRISHANHFFEKIKIRPYTVRICSFNADVAVAYLGERFRSPALVALGMNWDKAFFLNEIKKEHSQRKLNKKLVLDFESQILASGAGHVFFTADSARVYDRAVCVFPDVSAEALGEVVLKKFNLSPFLGWQKLGTTNMCRWGGSDTKKMFREWWLPEPSPEVLRGLLVFSLDLLQTKDFAQLLLDSYHEIKLQQSWTV